MEPFALILAAMLAQTQAAAPPPPPPQALSRDAWMAMFDRMDTNRDGQVTPEERRAARPQWGDAGPRGRGRDGRPPRPRRDGGEAMPRVGETRDAFLARAAERFERLDADRNGRIDPTEVRGRGMPGDVAPPPRP